MHPGRVFTTFIAMGIVIEVITANGASLVANTSNPESTQNTGKALLKAALILQIALMAGFVALASKFYYNCHRAGVLNSKYFTAASLNTSNIDDISPILKDEWFFWVFETVVMFANTTLLNVFHPMRWLPRSNRIYLATDGVTEVEGPGYEDRRPFLLTLFDPFDIVGMITKKGKKEKFWEVDHQPSTSV
ncbi:unnamed protein product [Aspergillus oryzae]|uniref:Unnamed protein product n=1 Tax=Aspergillus oryzae TaxID=5062 RepID=A0AAN4YM13_ASPOZ|nr:unnamed protein product [Aspergillus oryzae]